jgi:hypothetical protein
MPDGFLPLIVFALVAVGILVASMDGARGVQTAFQGYFAGYRPDPWPRGVQEEDGVRPWGTYHPSARAENEAEILDEGSVQLGGQRSPWPEASIDPDGMRGRSADADRSTRRLVVRPARIKATVHARS